MTTYFSREDYLSPDGMVTGAWGSCLWHFLHVVSFNYPLHPNVADKKHYREFVLSLQHILPCRYCRENFSKNLKKVPLRDRDLSSRTAFSKWLYRFHKHVNKMLGKKTSCTYVEIRDKYEHFRSRCGTKQKTKKEKGCVKSYHGNKKLKCVVKVMPEESCTCASIDFTKSCFS